MDIEILAISKQLERLKPPHWIHVEKRPYGPDWIHIRRMAECPPYLHFPRSQCGETIRVFTDQETAIAYCRSLLFSRSFGRGGK